MRFYCVLYESLLIRTLLLRDANDGNIINYELLNKSDVIETISNDRDSEISCEVKISEVFITQEDYDELHDDYDNESDDN